MNQLNNINTVFLLLFCLFFAGNSFSISASGQNPKQFIVVIDPGHGGKDPGAVNKSIREKDIVLDIGMKLGKMINDDFPEIKVIYTRKTDVFIPLIERTRIANKNKANLFISLHANACSTPSIRGTETFFLGTALNDANLEIQKKENSVILLEEDYSVTYEGFDPNSSESDIIFETIQSAYMDQSMKFADDIQHQFVSRTQSPNRGVKQAGFLVLRLASMPSVLVEAGFLSNNSEANYLNSDEGQEHIAISVFEAFKKFKNRSLGAPNTKSQVILASTQVSKDMLPNQEKSDEIKKTEEKPKVEIVEPTAKIEKAEPEKASPIVSAQPTEVANPTTNEYFSVQIAANTKPVEPNAANFKGLKNVRREKDDQFYRYYIGNENSLDNISAIHKQIILKFPQAFIVSFVNGKRIPLNVGSK